MYQENLQLPSAPPEQEQTRAAFRHSRSIIAASRQPAWSTNLCDIVVPLSRCLIEPAGHVFVSYNSKDRAFVKFVVDELKVRGIDIWYDQQRLFPGDPYGRKIEEAIRVAGAVLAFLSPNGFGKWQEQEIQHALNRPGMRIIPVLIDNAPLPSGFLANFHSIELEARDDKAGMERLLQGIRVGDAPAPPVR